MNTKKLIIGSRGSDLALWQANYIQSQLQKLGCETEIKIIKTQGDIIQNLNFDKLEGKGFFTKEIEDALLKNEIDLAIHSHKDLPTENTTGLTIAAVSEREQAIDCIFIHPLKVDLSEPLGIKKGSVIATSSARRKSQIKMLQSNLVIKDIRGNVPTRLNKVRTNNYDAVVLAIAGVKRLQLNTSDLVSRPLTVDELVPAPAQGVLAIQTRENDVQLIQLLSKINNIEVQDLIAIERGILNRFDGGCQLPLGAMAIKTNDLVQVKISKANSWNKSPMRFYYESKVDTNLVDSIVENIKSFMPKSVFVSTSNNNLIAVQNSLQDNGFTFKFSSLINIVPNKKIEIEKTDWIFFSSKKAVQIYNEVYGKPSSKIAAIGAATALKAIEVFGVCDFSGNDKSPEQVAKLFEQEHHPLSVLFPVSNKTKDTVFNSFSDSVKIEKFALYETTALPDIEKIENEIMVFTSPSNFKSYVNQHGFLPHQKLIAFGKTTAKEMENCGITNYFVCHKNTSIALLEKIYSICTNGYN